MSDAQYFVSARTGALLRRDDSGEAVFVDGEWHQPTGTILNHMIGQDDDVDEVTEAVARESFPDAF